MSALEVDGWDLVRRDGWTDREWGSFVMAPWVGRLRNGRVRWRGRTWDMPLTEPPHALHGTGRRALGRRRDHGDDGASKPASARTGRSAGASSGRWSSIRTGSSTGSRSTRTRSRSRRSSAGTRGSRGARRGLPTTSSRSPSPSTSGRAGASTSTSRACRPAGSWILGPSPATTSCWTSRSRRSSAGRAARSSRSTPPMPPPGSCMPRTPTASAWSRSPECRTGSTVGARRSTRCGARSAAGGDIRDALVADAQRGRVRGKVAS